MANKYVSIADQLKRIQDNQQLSELQKQMASVPQVDATAMNDAVAQAQKAMATPFTYNYANDPSYKALYEVAVQNGQKAMKDTMGKASAMTGGYANSYMQMAGQGAYNDYMSKLNEQIPTLENAAYQRYRQGISDAIQNVDLQKLLYGNAVDQRNQQMSEMQNQYNNLYKIIAEDTETANNAIAKDAELANIPYENQMNLDYQTALANMKSGVDFAEWKKQQDYTNKQKQTTATDNIDSTISYYNNLADRGIITKEQASEYIKSELLGGGGNNPTGNGNTPTYHTQKEIDAAVSNYEKAITNGDWASARSMMEQYVNDGLLDIDKGEASLSKNLIERIYNQKIDRAEALNTYKDYMESFLDDENEDALTEKWYEFCRKVGAYEEHGTYYKWDNTRKKWVADTHPKK